MDARYSSSLAINETRKIWEGCAILDAMAFAVEIPRKGDQFRAFWKESQFFLELLGSVISFIDVEIYS